MAHMLIFKRELTAFCLFLCLCVCVSFAWFIVTTGHILVCEQAHNLCTVKKSLFCFSM